MTRPEPPESPPLDDVVELVRSGQVDLGAYTQAEMAVALGDVPALAGVDDAVLAEAVRSLAARGVLHRLPGESTVEVVGDLGLLLSLAEHSIGTLEIRRGHAAAPDSPWRWLISVFGSEVVGIDRIDALGLHRLSLFSVGGISEGVAERLVDGPARVPREAAQPVPISDAEVRALTEAAPTRWQLIHRVPREGGSLMVLDALVLRVGPDRVDLVTRPADGDGYQRVAVDAPSLGRFLRGLFELYGQAG